MESIAFVSPSIVLPQNNPIRPLTRITLPTRASTTRSTTIFSYLFNQTFSSEVPISSSSRRRVRGDTSSTCCFSGRTQGGEADEDENVEEEEAEVERALHLDGSIPGTSDEFVKRVSSRAYDMRRHLQQTLGSSSYDVLEANPWREASKPVYVLTQRENQLCTMKTRRNHSEVERELGMLFSNGENLRSKYENKTKKSRNSTKFRMLVEDVREGILVFEDENDAARYCSLLNGGGQGCEGVAETDASSVFDLCRKIRALAVLFRRGGIPPLPENLELNLKAKKRSLEDQDDLI